MSWFLIIASLCISEEKIYFVTACRWQDVDISCDYGRPPAIKIVEGLYGRMTENVCPSHDNTYSGVVGCNNSVTQLLKKR